MWAVDIIHSKGAYKILIGIDPYNNCADYEVDILDYKVKPESA
jgi:predicted RNA-binding protein associated with RNAse of E/G family